MRDMTPLNPGPPGALNATSVARAQAREQVAGWMAGTSSTQPPADILRVEQLGSFDDTSLCFSAGTFCWLPAGAGARL
jgi:hypothetical protein